MKNEIDRAVMNAAKNVELETEEVPVKTLEEITNYLKSNPSEIGDPDSVIWRLYKLAVEETGEKEYGKTK